MTRKPEKMLHPSEENNKEWPIGMLPDGTLNEVKRHLLGHCDILRNLRCVSCRSQNLFMKFDA